MIKITEQKGVISMGRFVNSGNSAFQVALNSEIYVDKTGLLAYTNKVMDTTGISPKPSTGMTVICLSNIRYTILKQ